MNVSTVSALIELVAKKPALWNKRDPNHSCRLEVAKCWHEISTALKIDENTLRKKWKYLRDQYCVKLGEVQTSPEQITPKWKHYNALSFLKCTVTARIYSNDDFEDDDNVEINDESSSDYFERLSPKLETKKKRKLEKEKRSKTTESKSNSGSICDKEVEDGDDEHIFFFKSLFPHVRKIPESKLLTFRSRLQSLVEEYAYAPSAEFVPEYPITIKGSPPRYSSDASDPIDTSV